jgi:hypothetical protein
MVYSKASVPMASRPPKGRSNTIVTKSSVPINAAAGNQHVWPVTLHVENERHPHRDPTSMIKPSHIAHGNPSDD